MTTSTATRPVISAPLPATKGRPRRAKVRTPKHLRSNLVGYLMIAPMVVLLGIFVFWPLIYAFYLSTFQISFYKGARFVGLKFYRFVLSDPDFWNAIVVGLKFSLMVVPTSMIIALFLASFIKSLSKRASALMKTTIYVPAVVSSVVASVVFVFIYQDQGFANWFIGLFGASPLAWLNDPGIVLPAIAAPAIWLGFGVSTLVLVAALLDIPDSYYESACLDGANFFHKLWYITIPMLKNILLFLLVTGFTLAIQEYQLPLIMTNGGPVNASTTPNLYIFNNFRDGTPFSTSYSLTAALMLFIVLGAISVLIFRLVNSDKAIDG